MKKSKAFDASIIITGMGIVSPLGQGTPAFAQALLTGQNRFTKSTRFPMLSFPLILAELKDFVFENTLQSYSKLPIEVMMRAHKLGQRAPLTIQTSIAAALEAWEQAHLFERKIKNTRIGIVIAGQNISQNYQYNLHETFQKEPSYLLPSYALRFMDSDQVGTLSELFGIKGEGFTTGGASASGNIGLIHGFRLIKQDLVDICLIVGALADLSPLEVQGFYNIGALGGQRFSDEPAKACRPFDRDRDGFIWSQSSGCLILESAITAQSDGIPSLGKILGTAIELDGHSSSSPDLKGELSVMQRALDSAKMSVADLQYINTHGSASVLGDETEIAAIHAVLGEHISRVWLNSTKSLVGHGLWSAGIIEAIATLLQLQMGFVHPNLNLENPIDQICRFVGLHSETVPLQVALSNSFGFGGINTSILFSR